MADSVRVYNAFLEDDNCGMFFPYVGEKSVLGLTHPQYIFKNKDKHTYAMVALYKFVDTGDAEYLQYLNEKISVCLATTNTKRNTDSPKIVCFTLNITAIGESGNVTTADIIVTSDTYQRARNVYGTRETWTSSDKKKYTGLGIWVDITDYMYVMSKTFNSLSTNSCPLDVEHYPSSYSAEYLSNDNAVSEKNICNNLNTINSKTLCTGIASTIDYDNAIRDIIKIIDGQPHKYPSNTVTYNPTYTPSAAGTEETVAPFGIRVNNEYKFLSLDSINKTFSVPAEGIYQLQIKNGFYLIQGETRLDVKVYVNNDEVREMSFSTYLTSNQEGLTTPSKAIKNTFSTNAYIAHLQPTDRIKITATWGNNANLRIENETMVTVTAMQFNMYKRNVIQ